MKLAGANIEVWSDGTCYIVATESMFQTATRHGFRWWTPYDWTSTFDNFSVQSPPPPPPPHAVTRVVLSPTTINVGAYATQTLAAQAYDAANHVVDGAIYAWTTANAGVATATSHGPRTAAVRGVSSGTTAITVTVGDASATASVNVTSTTILISDSFTGTAETPLSTHAPEWNQFGDSWTVNGPMAVLRGGGVAPLGADGFQQVATIDAYVSDGVVGADWAPAPAGATLYGYPIGGLVFRAQDASNYFVAGYGIAGDSTLALLRFVAGNWTLIAQSNTAPIAGRIPHLDVRLSGPNISVLSDGVAYITATDATFMTATKYGFRWWPAYDWASHFDNFSVAAVLSQTVPDRVIITSESPIVSLGRSKMLTARAYDAAGVQIPNVVFSWSSSDAAIVSATARGGNTAIVTGLAYGSATISAIGPGGTAGTMVMPVPRVASVIVTPPVVYVAAGAGQNVTAQAFDAVGHLLEGVSFQWSAADPLFGIAPTADTAVVGVVGAIGGTHTTVTATAWGSGPSGSTVVYSQSLAATCFAGVYPASASFGGAGGQGTITTDGNSDCAWTASSDSPWVTLSAPSGVGISQLGYTVAPNPSPTVRIATVTIHGATFLVTQDAAGTTQPPPPPPPGGSCIYSVMPPLISFGAGGGSQPVTVTALAGCVSTLSAYASWIFPDVTQGSGTWTVTLTVGPNTDASTRATALQVANTLVLIEQAGSNSSPSSVTRIISSTGRTGTVAMTASSDVPVSDAPWLTAQVDAASGLLTYSASAEPVGTARQGHVFWGSSTLTIVQPAAVFNSATGMWWDLPAQCGVEFSCGDEWRDYLDVGYYEGQREPVYHSGHVRNLTADALTNQIDFDLVGDQRVEGAVSVELITNNGDLTFVPQSPSRPGHRRITFTGLGQYNFVKVTWFTPTNDPCPGTTAADDETCAVKEIETPTSPAVPYLENLSGFPVVFKFEECRSGLAVLEPGGRLYFPIDGVKPPAFGGDWYKVIDTTKVVIEGNGEPFKLTGLGFYVPDYPASLATGCADVSLQCAARVVVERNRRGANFCIVTGSIQDRRTSRASKVGSVVIRVRRLPPLGRSLTVAVAVIGAMMLGWCRSSFPCEGIRNLRVGMTETQVRQLLGPPAYAHSVTGVSGQQIPFDLGWDYDHRPSMFWLSVRFNNGRLVLADAGRRRFLDDDQTLFYVTAKEKYESARFNELFCR